MTDVKKLIEILNAETINFSENREITTGYCGDFLSFVISKAPVGAAWFTVMSNVNVAAVALLAEVPAVVLCEGVKPDEGLSARCKAEGINLISTELDAYGASVILGNEIK
ncbi:MAG: hypothetical protein LBQ40_02905 [Clostridiales bacterium]|jgi:hypothetical protein|nr:hypothetical protein [Clostridiales bacterium]